MLLLLADLIPNQRVWVPVVGVILADIAKKVVETLPIGGVVERAHI